jgi:hypothetical protein
MNNNDPTINLINPKYLVSRNINTNTSHYSNQSQSSNKKNNKEKDNLNTKK